MDQAWFMQEGPLTCHPESAQGEEKRQKQRRAWLCFVASPWKGVEESFRSQPAPAGAGEREKRSEMQETQKTNNN